MLDNMGFPHREAMWVLSMQHPESTKSVRADPQYELVAPKLEGPLDDTIRTILTNGLVTRFSVTFNVAGKFILEVVEQWGKLRRLEGGDIMHAHDIVSNRMDGRDASFVCVHELIVKCSYKITYFYILPNSMSNLVTKTSDFQTFLKFLSYKLSLGNFGTSSSSPFPKVTNSKRRSPKPFVSQLFSKLLYPVLVRCYRFHIICRLGACTPLTSNPSSVWSAVLKTRKDGG